MTFSIVARCEATGMFGTAIASSSPAVAARCSFVEAGVGAVSSQNITDPSLGVSGISLMRSGAGALEMMNTLKRGNRRMEYRQLLAVDKHGDTAVFSGEKTLGVWSEAKAKNAAAAGNLLADKGVVGAMLDEFSSAAGHLGDRLLAALQAGLRAGGEAGPVHSAGIKIVHQTAWPYADLRCDWSDSPVAEMGRIWKIYKPQMDDYILRALSPESAPNYGVAGETDSA